MASYRFIVPFFLVIALGIYLAIGDWRGVSHLHWLQQTESLLSEKAKNGSSRETLVDWLHQRAKEMPDDPPLWSAVAGYALLLEDYAFAKKWCTAAMERYPDNPHLMRQFLQIDFAISEGHFDQKARDILKRVIKLSPDDTSLINFMAMDAFSNGDYVLARQKWQQLLTTLATDSDILPVLYRALRTVEMRLAEQPISDTRIAIHVNNLEHIQRTRAPTDFVFISIREPGAPMPWMAKKLRISELMPSVSLGPEDNLIGGDILSQEREVVISLKVTSFSDALATDNNSLVIVRRVALKRGEVVNLP